MTKETRRAIAELANLGFMLNLDGCMTEEEYKKFNECLDIIQKEFNKEETWAL